MSCKVGERQSLKRTQFRKENIKDIKDLLNKKYQKDVFKSSYNIEIESKHPGFQKQKLKMVLDEKEKENENQDRNVPQPDDDNDGDFLKKKRYHPKFPNPRSPREK